MLNAHGQEAVRVLLRSCEIAAALNQTNTPLLTAPLFALPPPPPPSPTGAAAAAATDEELAYEAAEEQLAYEAAEPRGSVAFDHPFPPLPPGYPGHVPQRRKMPISKRRRKARPRGMDDPQAQEASAHASVYEEEEQEEESQPMGLMGSRDLVAAVDAEFVQNVSLIHAKAHQDGYLEGIEAQEKAAYEEKEKAKFNFPWRKFQQEKAAAEEDAEWKAAEEKFKKTQEMEITKCEFYARGFCTRGARCRLHAPRPVGITNRNPK